MYKPKKTIKFKSYSKSLVPKKIIYDNITLKIMEFKMRSTYNSNEGSVYTLNDKEKEVFKYHIRQMMNASHYNDCTERIMISIIHNIENNELCRYNKRALDMIINQIRKYWASLYDECRIMMPTRISDGIYVLNKDGCIGETTKQNIQLAKIFNKT